MGTQRISASQKAQSYGLAILAAITALVARHLLSPVLGTSNPYHTAWAAVVFSAWYCGVGPSIVTILVDILGIWYWFLPPTRPFGLHESKADVAGMIGFIVFSAFIIALSEANRRSLAKSQWAEEQIRAAHSDLEQKVMERTEQLTTANDSLRELSTRLQQLRDEERRHIARELHDSVGQLLAALGMNIARVRLQADKLDNAGAAAVAENARIVEQISKEIRTMSHLLHPPLLEAAGLTSAIHWYVDGFSERSKIKVDLEVPVEIGRLSDEMEITIFRLVQECLTNIHRHSGSDTATIVIREHDHKVVVEVRDAGKGIPLEKQLELSAGRIGVGFRGMRERLRQFGGALDILSDSSGTAVTATFPLQQSPGTSVNQGKAS